jgi:hypothetical protein
LRVAPADELPLAYPRWTANAIDTGMIVKTFSAKIRSSSRDALSIAAKGCADKPRMPLGLPLCWAGRRRGAIWRCEIMPATLALTFCDLEIF